MKSFYNQQRSKPFKAILSHFLPKLTQSAPTLVSISPKIDAIYPYRRGKRRSSIALAKEDNLKVGQASLLDFNYEKTKRTQIIAFSTQKHGIPKKRTQFEPKTWHSRPRLWSFTPARRDVLILAPGFWLLQKTKRTQRRSPVPTAGGSVSLESNSNPDDRRDSTKNKTNPKSVSSAKSVVPFLIIFSLRV
jgi:hypothetical protein